MSRSEPALSAALADMSGISTCADDIPGAADIDLRVGVARADRTYAGTWSWPGVRRWVRREILASALSLFVGTGPYQAVSITP
ncbi:MAG: hypothetical protein M0T79_03640 [Actinomycetota bacterium]|nr:hypothetical protein [Actinomycetota bacterium]